MPTDPVFSVSPIPAFRDNYIWMIDNRTHAVVIDPGDAAPVFAALKKRSLKLSAILLTHRHEDHIGGVAKLLEKTGVPVYGPRLDAIESVTHPVQEGDTAIIDFEGFVDGVAFEGGKGENHPLEIGSHTFIDTFEDQLVGKNAGDDVDVNVTFPAEYQAKDLAGKPALFKVKIHEIKTKELPELNDEFAQDVSEFNTLAEYKEDVKKKLTERKENEAKRTKEDEAVQKIIDKSTMELPDAMIDTQVNSMINEFAQRMASQGLTLDQYMQFSGVTMDKLKEQVRPEAVTRIKSSLVLEQIAKEENIEISDDEVAEEIEKMAKAYGMEADKLKEYMGDSEKESMKRDLAIQKAVDLIMENVKERAKAKSKKEKEAEAAESEE